jgi:hypothetical protein
MKGRKARPTLNDDVSALPDVLFILEDVAVDGGAGFKVLPVAPGLAVVSSVPELVGADGLVGECVDVVRLGEGGGIVI